MHSLDLAFPLFDDHGAPLDRSLVPAMLVQSRPSSVIAVPRADSQKRIKIQLDLSFLPQEFFPKLVVWLRCHW